MGSAAWGQLISNAVQLPEDEHSFCTFKHLSGERNFEPLENIK